jgi:hypothetical protein
MFILNYNECNDAIKKVIDYSAGLEQEKYCELRMEIKRLLCVLTSGGRGQYHNLFDLNEWDVKVLTDAGVDFSTIKTTYTDHRGMRLFPIYGDRSNLKEAGESLKRHIDDAIGFVEGDHLRKTDEWEDLLITLAMLHHPYQEGDPYHWSFLQPIFSRLIDKVQCYEASGHNTIKEETDNWIDYSVPRRIKNKRKEG